MGDKILALKYRPHRFEDIVGQRHVVSVLQRIITRKDATLPHSLIFTGPRGSGKTTLARIIGATLNCTSDDPPCGVCPTCSEIFDAMSPICLEVNSATHGLVENVRDVLTQLRYAASYHQVVVWDEAHSISKAGFNAMLKAIEEGSLKTTFIFITTEPHRIPITIYSRSMVFKFTTIHAADIEARLRYIIECEKIKFDDAVLPLIVQQASGALRDAIMIIDQLNTGFGELTVSAFEQVFGTDPSVLFKALDAGINDFDEQAITRSIDDIIYRLPDPFDIVDAWLSYELAQLASPSTQVEALKRMEMLWILIDKIKIMGTPRAVLRTAASLMSGRITRKLMTEAEVFKSLGF